MGYHHVHDEAKPSGASGRKAIAIAGDTQGDIDTVSNLIDNLGLDPLPIGALAHGRTLEPSQPAFGANLSRQALAELLGVAVD